VHNLNQDILHKQS